MSFAETILATVIGGIILIILSSLWSKRVSILNFFLGLRYKFFPQTQVITFAVKHNDEFNSGIYYDEIKKYFLECVKKFELSKSITYRDFSDIFLFDTIEQAQAFRDSKDLDLILWGEFSNDHLKTNGSIESEFVLNYTYAYGHGEKNQKKMGNIINQRISDILSKKNKWKVREERSLEDVRDVSDGFFTTALFVLGLTLGSRGRISESLNIFEKLYKYLDCRKDDLSEILKPYIKDCYVVILTALTLRKRIAWDQVETVTSKILWLEPTNMFALTNLAHSQYKLGKNDLSEQTSLDMIRCNPRSGAARINLAFIYCMKGKYARALKHYKTLLNNSKRDFDTLYIIEFLNDEYESTNEPALLFGAGFVSYYLNEDYQLAKIDFERFIKKANREKYGVMHQEAIRIHSKLM